jgi:hypothetical protein
LIQSIQIRLIFLNKSKTSLFITDRAQSQMAHNGHALGRPPPHDATSSVPDRLLPPLEARCCRPPQAPRSPGPRPQRLHELHYSILLLFSLSRELVVAATMSLQQTRQ